MSHILVVEDEVKIAELLRAYLEKAGFQVSCLHRGDQVEAFVIRHRPDLVVLDLQLPGKDGLDVCRSLRAKNEIPVLMLTARIDEIDRILGLEVGADDYVCKPFSPREVVARIRSILRRSQPQTDSPLMQCGVVELNATAFTVSYSGSPVKLTKLEFGLLQAFMEHPGEALSRSQLLVRAKGVDFDGYERNIDSHIKNLRKKIPSRRPGQEVIEAIYGVGYRFNPAVLE